MYSSINNKSWSQLFAENTFAWRPPFTVHLPIQPLHAPTFVYVDGAFNAFCLPIVHGLSVLDQPGREAARTMEIVLVQFAFGNPPFVPDFHYTKLSLQDGRYPVAEMEYFAQDLHYRFKYACRPMFPSPQALLWISGTVTNESEQPTAAHVWAKVNIQRECDVMEYHYRPFHWNASNWLPCDRIRMKKDCWLLDGAVIGKVVPSGFDVSGNDAAAFEDKDFNLSFGCESPYVVQPSMRIKHLDHAAHFQGELVPGQSRSFQMAILTDIAQIQAVHLETLQAANYAPDCAAAVLQFQEPLQAGTTELVCAAGNWDRIFSTLQCSTLQMLVRIPGKNGLLPLQGGSSERHFIWLWEAVCMLMPMLALGHFKAVRQALDFIFSLQDGGCPPEGHLTTTRGSIGTTGPRWLNTTGAALALAADYYRFSGDKAYLETYCPKILRAADWIVGEIQATRRMDPDGHRQPTYGLMPFGHATDGDIGHVVAFTDSYTFWGLSHAVALLETMGHPQAGAYRHELEQYRADLTKAIDTMIRPDGFIERRVKSGDPGRVFLKSENLGGGITLAYTGVLDVFDKRFSRYVRCFETHHADGYFTGKMDRDIVYIGLGECEWQDAYLKLGEWKKAWATLQAYIKYGMTQDTYQVQERFSKSMPEFTPWQPNGSGNGRALEMMVKSVYFDYNGVVTVLGGFPFEWLAMNKITALNNLHTPHGLLSIKAVMENTEACRVTLTAQATSAMPKTIRFPSHFKATPFSPGIVVKGNGYFDVVRKTDGIAFRLFREENA